MSWDGLAGGRVDFKSPVDDGVILSEGDGFQSRSVGWICAFIKIIGRFHPPARHNLLRQWRWSEAGFVHAESGYCDIVGRSWPASDPSAPAADSTAASARGKWR